MGDHATDPPVEHATAEALRTADERVAVAEAATGGLVGTLLTRLPGAGDLFERGYVTYSYDSLREVLAVPRETLDEHGAVSAPTVEAMARAVRDRARTDWGLAVAGIAGPDGGTDRNPVGTCYIGVARAAAWGSEASAAATTRYRFDDPTGSRSDHRERFARQALRELLSAVGTDPSEWDGL